MRPVVAIDRLGLVLGVALLATAAQAAPPAAAGPERPAAVAVLNPDLAGLTAVPGGALLAWGSDASIWRHDAATATAFGTAVWRPASTPHDQRVRALVAVPGTTAGGGGTLVAVGDGGLLLRSADGGQHWTAAAQDTAVSAAAAAPGGPAPEADLAAVACDRQRCLAVGPQNTLLLSTDGGARWWALPAEATPPSRPQGAFTGVVLTEDGTAWIAGADGRLWHDTGPGTPWRERPLPAPRGQALPAIDKIVADGSGVLLATGDGRLIAVPGAAAPAAAAAQVHRSARGTYTRLSAGATAGSWLATGSEGACAWRAQASAAWRGCGALPQRLLRAAASSPDGRHWVLAGEGGLLLHGRPPDRPWRAVSLPVLQTRPDLEAVAWSDTRQGFVAVGPAGLVLHGSADGRDWVVAHQAPRHYVHDVVAPRGGGALLAALSHRTLARSDDGGRHWRSHTFTQLHEPAFLFALHADRERGSVVVGGGQGALMVAPDGEHWHMHSTGHGREHLGLLALPGTPLVLLHGSGGSLTRVHSQEPAWHEVTLPSPDPVYGSFTGPDGHPWLVGGGLGRQGEGTVQRGSRDGTRWQLQRLGPGTLRTGGPTPDGRALIVAGDRGIVYRAERPADEPDGETPPPAPHWMPVAQPLPGAAWYWLQRDAAGQALWLGGSGGALIRSTDGGLSWQVVPVPTTASLRRPTWDPRRRAWWMPGRDGTLLRSDDDGRSWRAQFTHTREHLKGVWVDPRSGALLLYGARLVHLMPAEAP